jgi:hypothetical protein
MQESYCISNYLERTVCKLGIQGRFFFQTANYQGFRNNQVNLYGFFLLGVQLQTKIRISEIFSMTKEFRINQVLLYTLIQLRTPFSPTVQISFSLHGIMASYCYSYFVSCKMSWITVANINKQATF